MIQKMIFQLQAEQKDEDDHKNWCDLELQTNNDKNEDLDGKITILKSEIEELDAELKLTIKAIADNNDKLEELETYMKEETELRQENKEELDLLLILLAELRLLLHVGLKLLKLVVVIGDGLDCELELGVQFFDLRLED